MINTYIVCFSSCKFEDSGAVVAGFTRHEDAVAYVEKAMAIREGITYGGRNPPEKFAQVAQDVWESQMEMYRVIQPSDGEEHLERSAHDRDHEWRAEP